MLTVVFADIVGSTGLFEKLGDANASQLMAQLTGVLGKVFEEHQGRVVKLLGDGVFAVFPDAGSAITSCVMLQTRFKTDPVIPIGGDRPIQMQIGAECGEVIEIDGDCFGDAVNSAARLSDLAGADQILVTQSVWNELVAAQRPMLRSLGPIQLRGKTQSTHVYRVEWQPEHDLEATAMGVSMYTPTKRQTLALTHQGRTHVFDVTPVPITIGRTTEATLPMLDPVSRGCTPPFAIGVDKSCCLMCPALAPGCILETIPKPWPCAAPNVFWWVTVSSRWVARWTLTRRRWWDSRCAEYQLFTIKRIVHYVALTRARGQFYISVCGTVRTSTTSRVGGRRQTGDIAFKDFLVAPVGLHGI